MTELFRSQGSYNPTQEDVFAARRALLHFLPTELVLDIVELAEYWPKLSSTREAFTGPAAATGSCDTEWCYVLSTPIPSYSGLTVKPRKIAFNIECASEQTYDNLCSDFTHIQAAVIKAGDVSQNIMLDPLEDLPESQIHSWNISSPIRWLIHDVPSTWGEGDQHKVVWDIHQPLLHTLSSGDRVAVMVRGLIPGWMNCIYTITMDIHYAI